MCTPARRSTRLVIGRSRTSRFRAHQQHQRASPATRGDLAEAVVRHSRACGSEFRETVMTVVDTCHKQSRCEFRIPRHLHAGPLRRSTNPLTAPQGVNGYGSIDKWRRNHQFLARSRIPQDKFSESTCNLLLDDSSDAQCTHEPSEQLTTQHPASSCPGTSRLPREMKRQLESRALDHPILGMI